MWVTSPGCFRQEAGSLTHNDPLDSVNLSFTRSVYHSRPCPERYRWRCARGARGTRAKRCALRFECRRNPAWLPCLCVWSTRHSSTVDSTPNRSMSAAMIRRTRDAGVRSLEGRSRRGELSKHAGSEEVVRPLVTSSPEERARYFSCLGLARVRGPAGVGSQF